MPIYEYRCQSCGHHLEAVQRITADPLVSCPACGEDALRRLISQTSFVLKGSGWYATDYASKPAAASKEAEKPAAEKTAGDEKAKPAEPKKEAAESKPAAPPKPATSE